MPGPGTRVAVVVDDDEDFRDLLDATLTEAGFTCFTTGSGAEALELVRHHQPVLTTLDVGLPGIDGLEVARRLRTFSSTYIIILSSRAEEADTLLGLDAGADDYLTKPIRPRELRARVEAMLRRSQFRSAREPGAADVPAGRPAVVTAAPDAQAARRTGGNGWLSHNGLRLNAEMQICELDGRPVDLTRSEFVLLMSIVMGERRVISKSSLALDMRGDLADSYVSDADQRVVESHLTHLRRKLNDPVSSPRFIETVRGVGYRLTAVQEPDIAS